MGLDNLGSAQMDSFKLAFEEQADAKVGKKLSHSVGHGAAAIAQDSGERGMYCIKTPGTREARHKTGWLT